MARELRFLLRFKRDFAAARKHPEFDPATLEYVFELLSFGVALPGSMREHRLDKRSTNWAGMTECHLGADLLLIYRVRREVVVFHRIGTHRRLFSRATKRKRSRAQPRLRYPK